MKKSILRNYAGLIVKCGANVQQGQTVNIFADLDQPKFVRMVVEEAYLAGAREVIVHWNDPLTNRLNYIYQTCEDLGSVKEWEVSRQKYYCDILPVRIILLSEDPDGMRGIDAQKRADVQRMRYEVLKPYYECRENREQWCIAAVPGKKWARKVFPGMSAGRAVEQLWKAILFTSRVTDDPVRTWAQHNANLETRCRYLNELSIKKLRFYGDNGTDLTVGMIDTAQFCGGGERSLQKIFFNPNIPTEECFISPKRGEAEGIVFATKPLSYQGQLIDNFYIRFSEGRAVEVHAQKGEELLRNLINMDEGAAYLGECALVPQDSPIAESGILFYNTLFDENAACHLALGMGFADTIKGYEELTLEECRTMGINQSMVHEDFMIGYDGLQVDAILQCGDTVPIFRKGRWAFSV